MLFFHYLIDVVSAVGKRMHRKFSFALNPRPHIHADCLNTRDKNILIKVLHILQLLVKSDTNTADATRKGLVGRALVPYYRQLLPVLNIFCEAKKKQVTDKIEYSQRRGTNLQAAITITLGLFEKYGGADAFINIKLR